ncbi:MAG: hypothetical protein EON59_02860 [Alphaproteobacteria bacterium]|nr:MAG: hypothetical protein EON59_02860 [Alphaproteobacteria bacterium]
MTKTASATTRQSNATRPGASRALLARKAVARAANLDGEAIEASFPAPAEDGQAAGSEASQAAANVEYIESPAPGDADQANAGGEVGPPAPPLPSWLDPSAASGAQHAQASASWSEEDERALQAMIARRKAAGYQRRGRDVRGQSIGVGSIAPNPNTIAAAIVALVAPRVTVTRAELLGLMAAATFPHPKAKPTDPSWCQGYVAGALRDNFLALAAADAEVSAEATQ